MSALIANSIYLHISLQTGSIADLEKRSLHNFSKHQLFLIERRRQDVRDQAKEMAEASSNLQLIF